MNISKIMKMTVKEFLLTLINEVNTPLESKVESVECKVESVECNVESKGINVGRPANVSCLRDYCQREEVAGVISRMMEKALDTCFNRYDVEGIGMPTSRMLAVVGETLVDLDIMPEEYNVRDYLDLIKTIPGFENTHYPTLAKEVNKVGKLLMEKDNAMKIAVRELTKWMKSDSYIQELLAKNEN